MNIAEFAIKKNVITLVIAVVLVVTGISAFNSLSRLEDPEFTIKDALVITPYPGATAAEVEEEVSDLIEKAAQQLGQLKRVVSRSERGLSTVTVTIQDKYGAEKLPQVWDELRRKVGDAQSSLPPGALPSIVNDDFGDVYGLYYAITGDGYTPAEMKDVLDLLQRELLLAPDVKRIDFFGVRPEAIYVEMSREKLAQFGISKQVIYDALSSKNLVADSGRIQVGSEYVPLQTSGDFTSVAEFKDLLISTGAGGNLVFLGDVATIQRGYIEPPDHLLFYDGQPAYGLAISTARGGNVVTMGDAVKARLQSLEASGEIPFGVKINAISMQSDAVTIAIRGFVINLFEAIAIVLVVLILFMGVRSGLIIGGILFVTICGTLLVMGLYEITLERISLGALIIALGMLVDNAIVVVEGMQMKIQSGVDRLKAAKEVVSQASMPLLGATVIAVLAFASIGTSQDNTGEFCRSLFQVITISLMMSWITAITLTPLMCFMFIKGKENDGEVPDDPYKGFIFQTYRRFLIVCLKFRYATVVVPIVLLIIAVIGFTKVEQSFFPSSTRPQLIVDLWLDAGTHLSETSAKADKIREYLADTGHVTHVTTLVGKGANRFLLTYTPEKPDTGYAQLLADVEDYKYIDEMVGKIQSDLDEMFPEGIVLVKKFVLGPGGNSKIQARFSGPDPDILRQLSVEAMDIMHDLGGLRNIRTDWRNQVKVLNPILSDAQARRNGIDRPLVARTLQESFTGTRVGVYRDGDSLIPIISRPPADERVDSSQLENLQIWSPAGSRMIPIRQVVSEFQTQFENAIIMRRDRQKTIIAMADQISGNASVQFVRLRPHIEAMELPPGYKLEWGGEYEDSANAQAGLAATIPVFIGLMILLTIFLFNALRQPLIIWLCVPLALIGVTAGLLLTGQPFGFMALLGGLSLIGMLIKNAVVLIDEIDHQIKNGKEAYHAIVDSGVSRMRPVMMAALTTVLGMMPLLLDAFFVSMAVTIMFGLAFATLLTLIIVPVLYAIFFNARSV